MKFIKRKALAILLTAALSASVIIPLAACDNSEGGPEHVIPEYPVPTEPTFLRAEGEKVINEDGEEVYLRGVNAGGLFVTEHWMTGFAYTTPSNDYKSLTQTFINRFGEEKTKALWAEYRSNWWTEQDFKNCAAMGMNVIRLPFTYMNVDVDALKVDEKDPVEYKYAGINYDFSALDDFVNKAAEYGMYTILDLHGAYGSHNGQDHSGQIIGSAAGVRFFYDTKLQGLTVKLWSALSTHFKDNPYVAGYDILNEPGEKAGTTSQRHWDVYDSIYKAIRQTGDEHIVIFESCWDGKDLPQPSVYGWENCMYSFHHYTNNNTDNEANILEHNKSWNTKIEDIAKQSFGVPINMGEFTSYTSVGKWDYTLDFLNRLNWSWTSWTYKVWGRMPWGIVNISGTNADKVDAMVDDYETILTKFKKLRTDGGSVNKYTFSGTETTLEGVLKKYCTAPAKTERLAEGSYVFYSEDGNYLGYEGDVNGTTVFNTVEKFTFDPTLRLSYHPSNDGSVYLKSSNQNMCAFKSGGTTYLTRISSSNGAYSDDIARFFPVQCGDGWAFVSRSACKYITIDSGGRLRASASTLEDAAVFYLN